MTIQALKKIIIPSLKRNGVTKASLFGSYARNEATHRSDIDLMVKFKGQVGLFEMVGLKLELEKKTKKKVDLLTYNSVHKSIKKYISKDEMLIYEKRA